MTSLAPPRLMDVKGGSDLEQRRKRVSQSGAQMLIVAEGTKGRGLALRKREWRELLRWWVVQLTT